MKQINLLQLLFTLILFAFTTSKVQGQNGSIQGIITDENGLFVALNDNKEFYFYDLNKVLN